MLDTVRDADSGRILPQLVPTILDLLRTGEVAFHKDAREYLFRRVLIEVLHRICASEMIRTQAPFLFKGMLYVLRHDNEENGVTCCKTIIEISRSFRNLTEDMVAEWLEMFKLVLKNTEGLVNELLSTDSVQMDDKVLLPSTRSFKVLAEMGMVTVTFCQQHRNLMSSALQDILALNFEVLALESPTQKAEKEDYEAMGEYWSGMSSSIKNHHAYVDFITAQIKVWIMSDLNFIC